MVKKINENQLHIILPKNLSKDIKKHVNEFNYVSSSEFIREAIREKLYGKNIREQISNRFMEEIEKEKSYIFEEKKDLHERLEKIAKNF